MFLKLIHVGLRSCVIIKAEWEPSTSTRGKRNLKSFFSGTQDSFLGWISSGDSQRGVRDNLIWLQAISLYSRRANHLLSFIANLSLLISPSTGFEIGKILISHKMATFFIIGVDWRECYPKVLNRCEFLTWTDSFQNEVKSLKATLNDVTSSLYNLAIMFKNLLIWYL